MRDIKSWVLTLALTLFGPGTHAQLEEIDAGFRQLSPAEEQRLRAVLTEPVPHGAMFDTLRRHFRAKDDAAIQLFDLAAREANLREQVRLLPDAVPRLNLGTVLVARGEFEEGNALIKQAIEAAPNIDQKAFWMAHSALAMYRQFRDADARALIIDVRRLFGDIERLGQTESRRRLLSRTRAVLAITHSLIEQRGGRPMNAVLAAAEAEHFGKQAVASMAGGISGQAHAVNEYAYALRRQIETQTAAGQFSAAERSIPKYFALLDEARLGSGYKSGLYEAAAALRLSQREFALAEVLMRRAEEFLKNLGLSELHLFRTDKVQAIAVALWAQKKYRESLLEFDRLDTLAGTDERLQKRVQYPFERGLVYLGNQKHQEAAALFAGEVSKNAGIYGPSHFLTAQATGLRGVALWRTGNSANLVLAVPLLRAAVRDYMAPANADFLENIGIRKEVRELIFAAYLEAVALTPGEDPAQALGPADWVRGGVVQDAVADAAVRSAIGTPALADLVRQDQDARNEMIGLRKYLAGELGATAAVLPVVTSKIRTRISELESARERLQAQIKEGFPDYEQLVRPLPPSAEQIARNLGADEALLLLLPTETAVYAWALAADRRVGFVRVAMPGTGVDALVKRLRSGLDFAEFAGGVPAFDHAASHDLYRLLLAPLEATLAGKTQLVVAAGGSLGQLPLAVLLTEQHAGVGADAPWLIKRAGIAYVPSIGAWWAARRFSESPRAPEALMGWADPTFRRETEPAVAHGTLRTRNILLTREARTMDLEKDGSPGALRYADMPTLPETRDELLAVAEVLKANVGTDLRLGAGATRQSVLEASRSGELRRKKVVFFATHGLMAGDLPDLTQPALALAATDRDAQDPLSPLLKLDDVLALKLNADWVVLSACNTAAADGRAEEALSGLARGFFYAGSRSLLVTHWSVETESAKLLTVSTFEHYGANPMASRSESLRQAMLKVMRQPKFSHPAYWAPYALVGDGGR